MGRKEELQTRICKLVTEIIAYLDRVTINPETLFTIIDLIAQLFGVG